MPATIPYVGDAILKRLLGRTGVEEVYKRVKGTLGRLPEDKVRDYERAFGDIFTNRGGGIVEAAEDVMFLGYKINDDVAEQFLGRLGYGGFTDEGLDEVINKYHRLATINMAADAAELFEEPYQKYIVGPLSRLGLPIPFTKYELVLMHWDGLDPVDATLESITLYNQNSIGYFLQKLHQKRWGDAATDAALIAAPPLIEAALGRLHSEEFFADNALAFLIACYTRLVEEGKVAPGQRYGGIAAEYDKYKPENVIRNMWAAFDAEMAAP